MFEYRVHFHLDTNKNPRNFINVICKDIDIYLIPSLSSGVASNFIGDIKFVAFRNKIVIYYTAGETGNSHDTITSIISFPQSQIYQILDLKVPVFNMVTCYFMCYLYVIENCFTVTPAPAGIQMPAILWTTSHIDFTKVRFTAADITCK